MELETLMWKMLLDIAKGEKDVYYAIAECGQSPIWEAHIPDDVCAWFSPGKPDRIPIYLVNLILRLATNPISHRAITQGHNSDELPSQPSQYAPNIDVAMDEPSPSDPMHISDIEMDEVQREICNPHESSDQFERDSAGVDGNNDEERSTIGPDDHQERSDFGKNGDDEERSTFGQDNDKEESSFRQDDDEEQSTRGEHDDHESQDEEDSEKDMDEPREYDPADDDHEGDSDRDEEDLENGMLLTQTEQHLAPDDDVAELGDYDPTQDDDDRSEVADLSITTEPSRSKGKSKRPNQTGRGGKTPTNRRPEAVTPTQGERKFVPARFMTPIDVDMLV